MITEAYNFLNRVLYNYLRSIQVKVISVLIKGSSTLLALKRSRNLLKVRSFQWVRCT